ncbi:antitoxin MazE7 [Streptomyces sp. NBC_01565]|uniref:antitoxin MazE7 n=1 Tax=unclassified Streptomyces TaxID=2593676 RepID=UPI00225A2DE5|nr:antitoxin MazE7 [Streptomyces sp. NBC_01565]MCX4546597.1 antitoxin MazE7 [Streptomyces sp. NBC_01565]
MSDTTTLEVATELHDRLTALAAARGLDLSAYLAELTTAQENEAGLARAARAFDEAVRRPGFREGFEHDFGPASGHAGSRAA